MDYKVLVTVFVPEIDQKFEFYIPVNRYVEQVITIINHRRTGEIYNNGLYVRNTNIKNGTQLVLF